MTQKKMQTLMQTSSCYHTLKSHGCNVFKKLAKNFTVPEENYIIYRYKMLSLVKIIIITGLQLHHISICRVSLCLCHICLVRVRRRKTGFSWRIPKTTEADNGAGVKQNAPDVAPGEPQASVGRAPANVRRADKIWFHGASRGLE